MTVQKKLPISALELWAGRALWDGKLTEAAPGRDARILDFHNFSGLEAPTPQKKTKKRTTNSLEKRKKTCVCKSASSMQVQMQRDRCRCSMGHSPSTKGLPGAKPVRWSGRGVGHSYGGGEVRLWGDYRVPPRCIKLLLAKNLHLWAGGIIGCTFGFFCPSLPAKDVLYFM